MKMQLNRELSKEEKIELMKQLVLYLRKHNNMLEPNEMLELLAAIKRGCYKSMWDLQVELDMSYGIDPYEEIE